MGGLHHCPEGETSATHFHKETGMSPVTFGRMMKGIEPRKEGTHKFYKIEDVKERLGKKDSGDFQTIMEIYQSHEGLSYPTIWNYMVDVVPINDDGKRYHIFDFYRILEEKGYKVENNIISKIRPPKEIQQKPMGKFTLEQLLGGCIGLHINTAKKYLQPYSSELYKRNKYYDKQDFISALKDHDYVINGSHIIKENTLEVFLEGPMTEDMKTLDERMQMYPGLLKGSLTRYLRPFPYIKRGGKHYHSEDDFHRALKENGYAVIDNRVRRVLPKWAIISDV